MVLILFVIIALIVVSIFYYAVNHKEKTDTQSANDMVLDLEEETRLMAEKIQVMIQAGIVGDDATVKAINDGTYDGPWPMKRADGGYLSLYDTLRILKVAGINHRQNIDRYTGRLDVALVPEPTNQFDPNAIKIVAEDGHHLGYIEANQTDFVRSLALDTFPYRCTCFIDEHEDEFDGHTFYIGFVYIKQNMEIKRE